MEKNWKYGLDKKGGKGQKRRREIGKPKFIGKLERDRKFKGDQERWTAIGNLKLIGKVEKDGKDGERQEN